VRFSVEAMVVRVLVVVSSSYNSFKQIRLYCMIVFQLMLKPFLPVALTFGDLSVCREAEHTKHQANRYLHVLGCADSKSPQSLR
jgi:hypothetical protein